MADEISAFGRREEAERDRHQLADVVEGAGPRGANERLQFREGQFNGIEVGTAGRQEADLRGDRLDGRADRRLFVDGQVIEHHDVPAAHPSPPAPAPDRDSIAENVPLDNSRLNE